MSLSSESKQLQTRKIKKKRVKRNIVGLKTSFENHSLPSSTEQSKPILFFLNNESLRYIWLVGFAGLLAVGIYASTTIKNAEEIQSFVRSESDLGHARDLVWFGFYENQTLYIKLSLRRTKIPETFTLYKNKILEDWNLET